MKLLSWENSLSPKGNVIINSLKTTAPREITDPMAVRGFCTPHLTGILLCFVLQLQLEQEVLFLQGAEHAW